MKTNFFRKTTQDLLKPKEKRFANTLLVEIFFCLFFFFWLFTFDSSDVNEAYRYSLFGPYIDISPSFCLLIISIITFITVLLSGSLRIDKTFPIFLIRIPLYFIPLFFISGSFNWGTAYVVFQVCFAFYLGFSYKGSLKRIIPVLTVASLLLSLGIFLIAITKFPEEQSLIGLKYWMKLPFGQTNYLALYLIVFMVLTNVFFRGKRRKLLIAYNVIIVLAIILTNSRSALIVLAFYYLIEAILFLRRFKIQRWHLITLAGLVVAVGLVAVIFWDTVYSFISRFTFASLAENRLKVYKDVYALIVEHPWLGRSAFSYKAFDAVRAHNFILESLVQTGIIGTLIYLALIIIVLLRLLKIRQAQARHTLLAFYALTFLHGLVEPNLFSPWSDTLVWFLFGIGCALPKKPTKEELLKLEEKEKEPIPDDVKISLCMCTYNGEKYLREQLDSIVNQTKLPDEIIVFDDCSRDGTLDILCEYKFAYPMIDWHIHVNGQNAGWRVNFKKCLELATGDVIFLADQDDIWMQDKLAVMTRALIDNPAIQVLVSDYTPFYMDGAIDHGIKAETSDTKTVAPLNPGYCLMHCAHPGCTFAITRDALPDFFERWQSNFAHDALLWRTSFLKGALYHIDYASILFRRHSSNASSNKNGRISRAERDVQQKTVYMYRDCLAKLQTLPMTKENEAVLAKVSAWNEKRIALYEKPSLWKWIGLCINVGYYPSVKAYIKDVNAFLFKKKNKEK